jgi:hypothetical protein
VFAHPNFTVRSLNPFQEKDGLPPAHLGDGREIFSSFPSPPEKSVSWLNSLPCGKEMANIGPKGKGVDNLSVAHPL